MSPRDAASRRLKALCVVVAGALLLAAAAGAKVITADRRAISVIDGDSIEIGDTVYQLAGIDAPELGQACDFGGRLQLCGLNAAYELRKLVSYSGEAIRCFVRPLASAPPRAACMIGDKELSVLLLEGGYVTAVADDSPHYATAEHGARRASLGIWGSRFIAPSRWRAGERLPSEHTFGARARVRSGLPWKWQDGKLLHEPTAEHAACMVKGVVTADKRRIYYGPLDENFDSIRIDPGKGERFFCGDDEARQAGWRRAGEYAKK